MSILVVGTGALACLFAARLASTGSKVAMLGTWREGLAALRLKGVQLREIDGTTTHFHVEVIAGEHPTGDYRQALVLVKSWQTERAANQLEGCLAKEGIALTLQNGYGNLQILESALGVERAALGVTTQAAKMIEPGYVQHTGEGKVMLGSHPRLDELANILKGANFQVEIVPDPESVLWGKLVINAAINPMTALLRVPNGELLERPSARVLMAEAASEAARVAERKGIRLPYPDPVQAVEQVAENTAENTSSMLQDVLRGTPTEIDAINGAIIATGEELGVPTPVNRALWRLVRGLDHL